MLLEVKKITKIYGEGNNQVRALDEVSFNFEEGDFISIMGSSGSGKTTLLNCISSIDKPTSGEILMNDIDLTKLSNNELADYRAENISFIFQSYNLISNLTVYENIVLPLQISNKKIEDSKDKIAEIMKYLEIDDLKDKFPNQLSGGQQQRAAISRAIANSTKILIADEPTGALDLANSENLMNLLRKLNKEMGLSILMVTHDPLAAKFSKNVIFLSDGKIKEELTRKMQENDDYYLEEIMSRQKDLNKEWRI